MKTNTVTAGTEKMPDFSRENLNKYNDEQLTQEIIFGYLNYMSDLMKLLCGGVQTLLIYK